MANESFVKICNVQCYGCDQNGQLALEEPMNAQVKIYKTPDSEYLISTTVKCSYNTGAHGQRCRASHPETDKAGEGVSCPFSFEIRCKKPITQESFFRNTTNRMRKLLGPQPKELRFKKQTFETTMEIPTDVQISDLNISIVAISG